MTKRQFLAGSAVALTSPFYLRQKAWASTQLVIRTSGGKYDEVKRETVYEPFRKETGIEIVPVAATVPRLVAMAQSGNIDIDCFDIGGDTAAQLHLLGVLDDLDYASWKYTNVNDIAADARKKTYVGNNMGAFVMTYDTKVFKGDNRPRNWPEFWDTSRFPQSRTLPSMTVGTPNLEFALLADGVPRDQIYPIDIPRAFAAMTKIRKAVPKFWDTGSLSAQMMADGEAALGSIWNTRAQLAIDEGASLAIEWTDNLVILQTNAVAKGTPRAKEANLFIDYSLSPEVQARWHHAFRSIPINSRAFSATVNTLIDPEANQPWTVTKGFMMNDLWWAENRNAVSEAWSNWLLEAK